MDYDKMYSQLRNTYFGILATKEFSKEDIDSYFRYLGDGVRQYTQKKYGPDNVKILFDSIGKTLENCFNFAKEVSSINSKLQEDAQATIENQKIIGKNLKKIKKNADNLKEKFEKEKNQFKNFGLN